jgi:hypothetical protein
MAAAWRRMKVKWRKYQLVIYRRENGVSQPGGIEKRGEETA